jgi:hypothetical protein
MEAVLFLTTIYGSPPLIMPPLLTKWPYKRGGLSRGG